MKVNLILALLALILEALSFWQPVLEKAAIFVIIIILILNAAGTKL